MARVVIEHVSPTVDCGRHPVKRVVGDAVTVEADVFADGHDVLAAIVRHRRKGGRWAQTPMRHVNNDRWRGAFPVPRLGVYEFAIRAWVDHFGSWRRDLARKAEAGQDVRVDLLVGAGLVDQAARQTRSRKAAKRLQAAAGQLRSSAPVAQRLRAALDPELASLLADHAVPSPITDTEAAYEIRVDPVEARFSTWYELFPRSASETPGTHGTFADVEARLPYIQELGFDVLYLPPIHPIGRAKRKGPNMAPAAGPEDPGSPWAIGGPEGGHKSVHPALGTLADFRRLVQAAERRGIRVALDIAFQCSPDHPYLKEHPEWFRTRPDGTVQYAENPPKKYEDILPFDFETPDARGLWEELKSVFTFWIEQGVRMFRVDNPHTKPFAFWERLIADLKADHPDVVFLCEAFTRPKVMHKLAKLGFSQSYTYFTWRNTKWELEQYIHELTQTAGREYLRPNLWPNTPDILTEYLQIGGRNAFKVRLILAATMAANYGIYGPAFELCENWPLRPGSEEYLDSEKYQVRHWDLDDPASLRDLIARVNRVRRDNPALQHDWNLRFHPVDNEQLLCYSKHTEDLSDLVLVVVNLDPHHTHAGWVDLPLEAFGLPPHQPFQVHDLLSEARFLWHGARNYVELDPNVSPAHVFRVRRKMRTEQDFDYYL